MIIIKCLKIKNYRNVKHADLNDLKGLNIFIGPNNCGKTNILELINQLSELERGEAYGYRCPECNEIKQKERIEGVYLSLREEDKYLKEKSTELDILFNEDEINKLVPDVLEKQNKKLGKIIEKINNHLKKEIILKYDQEIRVHRLHAFHLSPFIHKDIIEEIKGSILYCPEQRLQNYKGKDFRRHIIDMKLTGAQWRKWIHFLKIIDPKIDDYKDEDLVRKIEGKNFVTSILEQGSGVRSLICLAGDILFSDDKIILIDEPELGLNPFVEQEFLKFLLEQSRTKQIFIATQDPTFLNPNLWKKDKVSVYLYSLIDEKFIKIDLDQNQADYSTFGGFLPHTTSLKDIHLYLEGTSDVYIFQIWLDKYLKERYPIDEEIDKENAWKRRSILNRFEIYHLGGSNWKHLLYTIPKSPYKCVIVLDGDKREETKNICEKYNKSEINASKFRVCQKIEDVYFEEEKHPIYCLEKDCIEKYLFNDFECKNPPSN